MSFYTNTEENYLKAIFHLSSANNTAQNNLGTSTNNIATYLNLKPATITNMLQKLTEKKLISYKPYGKVTLTKAGQKVALNIIRKHRLWEVFLVNKLGFTWDNVHDIAEQLEHVNSEDLIDRLEAFLQYPIIDPHGDPIPNKEGTMVEQNYTSIIEAPINKKLKVVAVSDTNNDVLRYLAAIGILLGSEIIITEKIKAADIFIILINNKTISISATIAKSILVI